MWTKLMCHFYALIHVKAYREKVVKDLLIFLSALTILLEISCIYFYGQISVFGLLMLIICSTLFAYLILYARCKNEDR